jgi:histidyl-tRNA synthetase
LRGAVKYFDAHSPKFQAERPMTEKRQFRAIKGTRDILPPDSARWNQFEHTAREVFESYNFGEIRLPIFEETSLFARSIGEETDVVAKEMYTFEDFEASKLFELRTVITTTQSPTWTYDEFQSFSSRVGEFVGFGREAFGRGHIPRTPENERVLQDVDDLRTILQSYVYQGEREIRPRADQIRERVRQLRFGDVISLRPEATASVARAYIEHNMQALSGNTKLYYIGPMFRRERPQKGRYRQFYQIGAEVLGQSDAAAIDAEVLEMLLVFFNRVGLTRTTLFVNSIGDKNCRPQYVELLRQELQKLKDKLCPDSQRRIETNPLRVLDSKVPGEQPIIETLPRISDHLCDDCRVHFAKLKDELNLRGIQYEENWRLVRGLDYYTRTTFEVIAEGLGSQNAVCGGGRYDGLVELLGGPPTKGIGFAIGTDRSILSIEEGGNAPKLGGLAVYVAWMGQASYPAAVNITRKLRDAGLAVELPPEEMKFKKSLGLADKLGARYAVILGEDEVASRTYTLKRLADADQKKLTEAELLEYLESERRQ